MSSYSDETQRFFSRSLSRVEEATGIIGETAFDKGGLDDYGTRVYPGRKISLLSDQVEYLFTMIISDWIEKTRTQYGGNL